LEIGRTHLNPLLFLNLLDFLTPLVRRKGFSDCFPRTRIHRFTHYSFPNNPICSSPLAPTLSNCFPTGVPGGTSRPFHDHRSNTKPPKTPCKNACPHS